MTDFATTLAGLGIKTTAPNSARATTAKASTTLDQSDFLALMTAQMKNQDPFNPTDNTQMIAQMAQFSSVAGIAEMNSTLQSMAAKLNATSASDALSYVGRTVLTPGNTAYPRTTGGLMGAVELASDTTSTTVTIEDAGGNVVRTLDLGAQKAGTASFDWDGTDSAGVPIAGGPFKITTTASNAGASVVTQPLVWAPVESVSLANGEPILNALGLGPVKLTAVRSVG